MASKYLKLTISALSSKKFSSVCPEKENKTTVEVIVVTLLHHLSYHKFSNDRVVERNFNFCFDILPKNEVPIAVTFATKFCNSPKKKSSRRKLSYTTCPKKN